MLKYAILEISGKQYKFIPSQEMEIDFQGGNNSDIVVNVLLLAEDGEVKIGKPYLEQKLVLKRLENIRGRKIRVSKYHAKANDRRVVGIRPKLTRVILTV